MSRQRKARLVTLSSEPTMPFQLDGPLSPESMQNDKKLVDGEFGKQALVPAWGSKGRSLQFFDNWYVKVTFSRSPANAYVDKASLSTQLAVWGPDWVFVREFAGNDAQAEFVLSRMRVPLELEQLEEEQFRLFAGGTTIGSEGIVSHSARKENRAFIALLPTVDNFQGNFPGDQVAVELSIMPTLWPVPSAMITVYGTDDFALQRWFKLSENGEEAARQCLAKIQIPVSQKQLTEDLGFEWW
ncbi:MAG: hypothetical protein KGS72_17530 [Cyanobacteria bacterium REEB67]|nr:hypothetical protein [Cyanobacteria bacterium REEB67]